MSPRRARKTEQGERIGKILESLRAPLVKAEHLLWNREGPDPATADPISRDLAQAAQATLKELRVSFENERLGEKAKHFLTRLKNLTKMIGEWAKATTWAELGPILKKQQTKSKTVHEKYWEYAREVEGLVNFFDTEHEGTLTEGPWTVSLFTSPRADWDDVTIGKLKHILAETTKILHSMGFGGAAGGTVFAYPTETLPGAAGSHDAYASYRMSQDMMFLAAQGDVNHVLHSLVHESGHRVYFRFLPANARDEWKAFFESESGPPDVDRIIKAWEAYASRTDDWEAQKYGRYTAYFARDLQKSDPDMFMWMEMISRKLPEVDVLDKYTGAPKKGTKPGLDILIENRGKIKTFMHPVTAYSGKDADELFAEVFAAWGVDGPGRIPEIVREKFKMIMPRLHSASMAERVASAFVLRTAVIREEDGKYCVRSPNNPAWNGGCYDSKGEAEDRLKAVEYFKHKGGVMTPAERVATVFLVRQAGELKNVWVVRDWNNRIEYIRELVFPEPVDQLVNYIRGAGRSWEEENTKLFTDEASAMKDLERRLKVVDKMQEKRGLYRHMHSDGRIIYVSVPDDSR